jgi:hypothetical protein
MWGTSGGFSLSGSVANLAGPFAWITARRLGGIARGLGGMLSTGGGAGLAYGTLEKMRACVPASFAFWVREWWTAKGGDHVRGTGR